MEINRIKFLATLGAVNCAVEPGEDGGGSSEETPKTDATKETPGNGDRESGDDEGSDDEDGDDDFKPITSRDEFERILGKRLHRERAKFADYDDLKTKVSDLEKANAQLSEDLSTESRKSLVTRISKETGVDEEDLNGSSEEELRASAQRFNDRLEAALQERIGKAGRSPYTGTGDERPLEPSTETGRERARALAK